jgi:hypothetical protein
VVPSTKLDIAEITSITLPGPGASISSTGDVLIVLTSPLLIYIVSVIILGSPALTTLPFESIPKLVTDVPVPIEFMFNSFTYVLPLNI